MKRLLGLVAVPIAGLALAIGVACSSNTPSAAPAQTDATQAQQHASQPVSPAVTRAAGDMSIPDLVKLAEPSVVRIETNGGVGTGFVVSSDGYVITNNHVVQSASGRAATSVKVTTTDGADYQAKIIGTDARSDLALLQIDAKNLTPLKLANLDNVLVGDSVVAIGFPLDLTGGEGASFSVTSGIISAKNRSIDEGSQILGAIQTDAAINHGNSGGPLLNLQGEVVGVNTAIAPDNTTGGVAPGIGFAVGSDVVEAVFEQLRDTGQVNRALLGVQNFLELRAAKAKELGLPANTRGVWLSGTDQQTGRPVQPVLAGGPAANAGIQTDDVIVRVDKDQIRTQADLAVAMIHHKPGDKVDVQLYRGGKSMTVQVTLGTPSAQ
jgi:S1-C subfamily serine protease